jgi:hypothetical protein
MAVRMWYVVQRRVPEARDRDKRAANQTKSNVLPALPSKIFRVTLELPKMGYATRRAL